MYTLGPSRQPNATLQILRLGNTRRTGPIPTCFGESGNGLTYLKNLSLSMNPGLTGPIPAELCERKYLFGLYLLNNPNLSGELPSCIWNMTNLRDLDLTGLTGLTGPLPSGLFALPLLEYLTVSGARFKLALRNRRRGHRNVSDILPTDPDHLLPNAAPPHQR